MLFIDLNQEQHIQLFNVFFFIFTACDHYYTLYNYIYILIFPVLISHELRALPSPSTGRS